ncbi:similar to ferric reductase transmembrane component 4 [Plenodomus lingam JN3]|uniref:Similar to ferric reductase transmembrane component 4 n=1 Tax=Leptosphaeria maculans (strain JN3 / isolate v23.1.3 / race Av1-4-5-6-7-8) TaxID=985895 RepID=E5ADK5_LEPMJ|nr:similar to ferric reductase transmembrane component 4 [Plenodomus lingam JN3]CBY01294.1 similar to ferric reductase transmembrane component 4 [Plenodomus lingam JN3]
MRLLRTWRVSLCNVLLLHITLVKPDGTGLIGYGKNLYNPTCAFACRSVIRKQTLACTPAASTENHGTAHNPVSTPPECFVKDLDFLKTMALCIDVYCALSDKPTLHVIQDYWATHLGTGTLGNSEYVPVLSFADALAAARQDEDARGFNNGTSNPPTVSIPSGLKPPNISSPLVTTTGGSSALNETRFVSPIQWQLQYNYLSDFEINEKGHSTMTIAIAVVAIALPILVSLIRFVPGITKSTKWSYFQSIMVVPPLFGKHHRNPVAGGLVPTRGQSLFIFTISILNIILLLAPYTITQPQASFTTRAKQIISIVGNRAGTMAMGNVVAMFLFSSRNNVLLYLTDWSYSTYMLLHRWLGYWTAIHTVVHSCMLWSCYAQAGAYETESIRQYWTWGIAGTVAVCALIPTSLLPLRQRFYEFFIVSHVALSLLFLIGYYYHIWYVYEYNWGYEIWMFVAAGIWALERCIRIARMVSHGTCTAIVTVVPNTDSEYIRIDIKGKDYPASVVFLCFPTLSWRFWETHPFSVSSATLHHESRISSPGEVYEQKFPRKVSTPMAMSDAESDRCEIAMTFFARVRNGTTKLLRDKTVQSREEHVQLRVLIEGPYNHSGRIHSQISRCSSVLCIAGGVGITACLPLLRASKATDKQLFWSCRKPGLVPALGPTFDAFPSNIKVETAVGQRLDLESIIVQSMARDEFGAIAIIVSGPPGLADAVREEVVKVHANSRPYVFLDEAFGW